MKLLEARLIAYDMVAPFIFLDFLDEYALNVENLWGGCALTCVNLFNHWSNISLQQEIIFQRDSYYRFVNDEDIFRCGWTLYLFVNSCDGDLINRTEEKYDTLNELEQGDITYLTISFDKMFNTSNIVITYLHDFIKNFSRMGFPRFQTKIFWF